MELSFNFRSGKNIFHHQLEVFIMIFKWLQGWLKAVHVDSSHGRRSSSWTNKLEILKILKYNEDN